LLHVGLNDRELGRNGHYLFYFAHMLEDCAWGAYQGELAKTANDP
jgi:hypothetical protein